MKKQIQYISILQTSKVLALVYGAIAILFVPVFLITSVVNGGNESMRIFSFIAPILYAILGFILTALFCGLYNLVAKYAGGIEFTLQDSDAS